MVKLVNESEPPPYERDPLDRFYTDARLASAIIERVAPLVQLDDDMRCGKALEPSSGHGAFLRAMRRYLNPKHLHAVDADLEAKAHAEAGVTGATFFEGDFLKIELGSHYDLVAGNPPYSRPVRDGAGNLAMTAKGKLKMEAIARAHVEKMLRLLNPDGGVCTALLRASFMATRDRRDLFRRCPPRYVDHVIERPSFTDGGGTDNHEYVVITWQRISNRLWYTGAEGPTTRWLSWQT